MNSKRLTIATLAAICFVLGMAGIVLADPSPNGPGQPGVIAPGQPGAPGTACGSIVDAYGNLIDPQLMPPGQLSGGFANAALHYAGSELNPTVTKGVGSPHAISQYDISCFQATMHGTGIPVPQ